MNFKKYIMTQTEFIEFNLRYFMQIASLGLAVVNLSKAHYSLCVYWIVFYSWVRYMVKTMDEIKGLRVKISD